MPRTEELYPLISEVIESGGEFRLAPRGTSMRPLLREGVDSVVLVRPDALKKHDICLYRRKSGSFVLHRIVKWRDGAPVFCGDNQSALEYGVATEDIVAVVAAVYRGERRIKKDALSMRLYYFFCCNRPVRLVRTLWRRLRAMLSRLKKRILGK